MPESAQLNILLETGADFILPYTIYDDDDNPIDLTGATVRAYLRESAAAPDYYEFLCRHNDAGGRITITMPHETTSEITFTSGVYDVVVVFEDGTTSYPLHGDATIRQGITKITDGNVLFMIGISNYEDLPEIGNVDRLYFSYDDQVIYRWNGMNYIATAVGRGIADITAELHGNIITYTFTYSDGTTSTIDLDYNLLDSPSFTGTPTAPTPSSGDDSTRIATTEYVTDAISAKVSKSGDTMTGGLIVSSGNVELQRGNITIGIGDINYRGVTITGTGASVSFRNAGERITIDQYPTGSAGGERFLLPRPESRSSDAWYAILTSKTPVTLDQGGTGGTDSGWITLSNSSVFTGSLYYRKIGVLLYVSALYVNVKEVISAKSYVELATLPSGYRPNKDIITCAITTTQTTSTRIFPVRITTSGTIYIYSNNEQILTSTNLYFTGVGTSM